MKKNIEQNTVASKNVSRMERVMIDLVMGTRQPVSENEKKLQAEINEIKTMGYIVEIPFDI